MGPILMARAVVKKMLTRHKGTWIRIAYYRLIIYHSIIYVLIGFIIGSIINIGSVVGVSGGRSGQIAYSAAKAGLIGKSRLYRVIIVY
jgi:NAD(P)-dependent dehydrogenase (short-subunit alcohol dehydrogenase family)